MSSSRVLSADASAEGVFEVAEPPPEWTARAAAAGWGEDLLPRAMRLRTPAHVIEQWLEAGFRPDRLEAVLVTREQLMFGTLRVRQASWEDGERVADLFANAAEKVGDWQLTVERGPNPFAQLRLQEHGWLQVLEDRGVILGAYASSGRNSIVSGREISVGLMSSWRIRDGFRGRGYSNLVRNTPGPCSARFPMLSYWYVRADNAAAQGWVSGLVEEWQDKPDEWANRVDGLSATVFHLRSDGRADARVRNTTLEDLSRCIALINRTHAGLDLFRPYSLEFLRERLDDPIWGPKPPFWSPVYEWADHYVLEDAGEIVACAGLWDRGRDVRERWRHPETGEERVVDQAALMDLGCAEGREDALAALILHLARRRADLGRTTLSAPLEFLPGVRTALGEPLEPETRQLQVMPFAMPGVDLDGYDVERPYTDLAYW